MRRFRRRGTRVLVIAAVIVGAAGILTACTPESVGSPDPSTSSSSASAQPTDTPEPTETPEPTDSSSPVNAAVTVAGVDTDGANVTLAGLVSGVVEDGGQCDFVLTSSISGAIVTVSSVGVANVSSTVCPAVQSPIESFTKGPWNVVLDYTSDATTISSAPQALEIP